MEIQVRWPAQVGEVCADNSCRWRVARRNIRNQDQVRGHPIHVAVRGVTRKPASNADPDAAHVPTGSNRRARQAWVVLEKFGRCRLAWEDQRTKTLGRRAAFDGNHMLEVAVEALPRLNYGRIQTRVV